MQLMCLIELNIFLKKKVIFCFKSKDKESFEILLNCKKVSSHNKKVSSHNKKVVIFNSLMLF